MATWQTVMENFLSVDQASVCYDRFLAYVLGTQIHTGNLDPSETLAPLFPTVDGDPMSTRTISPERSMGADATTRQAIRETTIRTPLRETTFNSDFGLRSGFQNDFGLRSGFHNDFGLRSGLMTQRPDDPAPIRASTTRRLSSAETSPIRGAYFATERAPVHEKTHRRAQTWMCPVCFFMENPGGAAVCEMCSAHNPAGRGMQIMQQCNNCSFQNGEYVSECEMCGEPLINRQKFRRDVTVAGKRGEPAAGGATNRWRVFPDHNTKSQADQEQSSDSEDSIFRRKRRARKSPPVKRGARGHRRVSSSSTEGSL
jgi:hypothetical protein